MPRNPESRGTCLFCGETIVLNVCTRMKKPVFYVTNMSRSIHTKNMGDRCACSTRRAQACVGTMDPRHRLIKRIGMNTK